MSYRHYIAANKELQLGEFGSVRINDKSKDTSYEIEEYATYEDAAGIWVSKIDKEQEIVKKHFKNKYIYCVSPSIGKFNISEELMKRNERAFKISKKCLSEFFIYIRKNIYDSKEIEIFTCFSGEEGVNRDRKLDSTININSFNLGNNFALSLGQYILVTT